MKAGALSQVANGPWLTEQSSEQPLKENNQYGHLISDKRYKNFVVRAKFKSIKGNSEFFFRTEKVNTTAAVKGYQAEVEPGNLIGSLYESGESGGRKWVVKSDPKLIQSIAKHGEWIQLEIVAMNDDITVSLNGVTVSQVLGDKKCSKEGHICLQLHAGNEMHVEYKDIAILELPEK